jgi:hypothetical protein
MNARNRIICLLSLALVLCCAGCVSKKEAGAGRTGLEVPEKTQNPSTTTTSTIKKQVENITPATVRESKTHEAVAVDVAIESEDNSSILDAVLNALDHSGEDMNQTDQELDRLIDEIDKM